MESYKFIRLGNAAVKFTAILPERKSETHSPLPDCSPRTAFRPVLLQWISQGKVRVPLPACRRNFGSMQRGEFGAVVGASGSGKSTLLNCIGGLDKADSGRVLISDRDIFAMGENERTVFRRQNIGFIFQSFHLEPSAGNVWMLCTKGPLHPDCSANPDFPSARPPERAPV